jgi:hypothetical protein
MKKPVLKPGPWSTGDATERIRWIGRQSGLNLTYKLHARVRLSERGLIVSDVLYVLKNGFVHLEPTPATHSGYNRYLIQSTTPNSNGREVGIVVIPDYVGKLIKIVTIMWMDEPETRSGNIIGADDG